MTHVNPNGNSPQAENRNPNPNPEQQRYHSFSGIRQFKNCEEQFRLKRTAGVIPAFRSPAMLMGSAVHEAIRMKHENLHLDMESLVKQQIEIQIEQRPEIPVQWGAKSPYDREGRTDTAIRKALQYWTYNQHVKVARGEVWFWFDLEDVNYPGKFYHMRGKFDQVIVGPDGELILRELKTGAMETSIEDLVTDVQVALQVYGIWKGFVCTEDNLPYIGVNDPGYHVHEWVPIEGQDNTYQCKFCTLNAEKAGIFPETVHYYDLCMLDPGKTKWNKGDRDAKGEPTKTLTFIPDMIKECAMAAALEMSRINMTWEHGFFSPPFNTGFNSPCKGCDVVEHCTKKVCKARYGA